MKSSSLHSRGALLTALTLLVLTAGVVPSYYSVHGPVRTKQNSYRGTSSEKWRASLLAWKKRLGPSIVFINGRLSDDGATPALLLTGDRAALPLLLDLLRDSDPFIRWCGLVGIRSYFSVSENIHVADVETCLALVAPLEGDSDFNVCTDAAQLVNDLRYARLVLEAGDVVVTKDRQILLVPPGQFDYASIRITYVGSQTTPTGTLVLSTGEPPIPLFYFQELRSPSTRRGRRYVNDPFCFPTAVIDPSDLTAMMAAAAKVIGDMDQVGEDERPWLSFAIVVKARDGSFQGYDFLVPSKASAKTLLREIHAATPDRYRRLREWIAWQHETIFGESL